MQYLMITFILQPVIDPTGSQDILNELVFFCMNCNKDLSCSDSIVTLCSIFLPTVSNHNPQATFAPEALLTEHGIDGLFNLDYLPPSKGHFICL